MFVEQWKQGIWKTEKIFVQICNIVEKFIWLAIFSPFKNMPNEQT